MALYQLSTPFRFGEFSCAFKGGLSAARPLIFKDAPPPAAKLTVDLSVAFKEFEAAMPDFFMAFGGVPLLSERALRELPGGFLDEVERFPTKMQFKGGSAEFIAVKTRNYLPLIDPAQSEYSDLAAVKLLKTPVFRAPTVDFFLARDAVEQSYVVASQKLVDLIDNLKLRIAFRPWP